MNHLVDVLSGFAIVSGIYVMTRKDSKGPALLAAAGNAFAHVEQGATGQKLG
jgi:hypothetical protein